MKHRQTGVLPDDVDVGLFTDKSSKDPAIVELYRDNDYLTAYAMHTDVRVSHNPHTAIGGDWDEYGALQRDFLIAAGLKPQHHLLDIGCGTGRLARTVVPYLNEGNYVGVDLSRSAIEYADSLSLSEGWAIHRPKFVVSRTIAVTGEFDYAWAFSVFNHLPLETVQFVIARVAAVLCPTGKFLFSYPPSNSHVRTGLKQFKHPFEFFAQCAVDNGLTISKRDDWRGLQSCACMQRGENA